MRLPVKLSIIECVRLASCFCNVVAAFRPLRPYIEIGTMQIGSTSSEIAVSLGCCQKRYTNRLINVIGSLTREAMDELKVARSDSVSASNRDMSSAERVWAKKLAGRL